MKTDANTSLYMLRASLLFRVALFIIRRFSLVLYKFYPSMLHCGTYKETLTQTGFPKIYVLYTAFPLVFISRLHKE